MTLAGTRPILQDELLKYELHHRARIAIKPGITGMREFKDLKITVLSTANALQLSKASVTSYLPYQKGVYFPSTASKEKISVGAERQRRYRAMKRWRDEPTER